MHAQDFMELHANKVAHKQCTCCTNIGTGKGARVEGGGKEEGLAALNLCGPRAWQLLFYVIIAQKKTK